MSVIKTIYKLPISYSVSKNTATVIANTEFNSVKYTERAYLNLNEDKDFFSEKVGKQIVVFRIRRSILKDLIKETEKEYEIKNRMYKEVMGYGKKNPSEVDSTGGFSRNLENTAKRLKILKHHLKKVDKGLAIYLEGQKKALSAVKKLREGKSN